MTYPHFQRARDFKFIRHVASLTLNSTSWANVPTIATITLQAQVGDVVRVELSAYHDAAAPSAHLDAVTEAGGTPTTSFATGGAAPTSTTGVGVGGWFCDAGDDGSIGGPAFLTVAAGDIVAGFVTLRLRYRTSAAAAKALDVAGGNIFFSAENRGPADPN